MREFKFYFLFRNKWQILSIFSWLENIILSLHLFLQKKSLLNNEHTLNLLYLSLNIIKKYDEANIKENKSNENEADSTESCFIQEEKKRKK